MADNFQGPGLRPSAWTTLTTSPNSSVVQTFGMCELTNNGTLIANGTFRPTNARSISIRGEWHNVFNSLSSGETDSYFVGSRAAPFLGQCCALKDRGIFFFLAANTGVGPGTATLKIFVPGQLALTFGSSFTVPVGSSVGFVLEDGLDGITAQAWELGNPTNSVTLTAPPYPTESLGDRVVFGNRPETTNTFKAYLDNVSVTYTRDVFDLQRVRGVGVDGCTGLASGDMDGDGKLDLVTIHQSGGDWLAVGDGRGNFTPALLGPSGSRPGQTAVVDADGDGDLDIFTCNASYQNQGNGVFTQSLKIFSDTALALGDLDNDGDPDAISSSKYRNDGTGMFSFRQFVNATREYSLALGDVNGDGFLDCSTARRVFLNNGFGALNDSGQSLGNDASQYGRAFGDLDNDGDLDLIVAQGGHIFLNLGMGLFQEEPGSLRSGVNVALGDINRDGNLDVALNSAPLSIYYGDGDGHFAGPVEEIPEGTGSTARAALLVDCNDDGWLDLVHTTDTRVSPAGAPAVLLNKLAPPRHGTTPRPPSAGGTIQIP